MHNVKTADVHSLFSLQGKVAIVTGGSGLYGFPICESLAEAGAVVIIAFLDFAKNRACAERLQADDRSVLAGELDLGSTKSIETFHRSVLNRHGRVDVLINNAVARPVRDFWKSTAGQWEESLRVNITGVHWMTRVVAESMASRGAG